MRTVLAGAVVLALGSTFHMAAQQANPSPGQGPAPAGRGRGGAPGGGPESGMNTRPPNGEGQKPAFAGQTRAPEHKLNVAFDVVTVSEGLANPWGLAFLPDGQMLQDLQPQRERIRNVRQGPDGAIYLLTDNAKGRILKIVPKA